MSEDSKPKLDGSACGIDVGFDLRVHHYGFQLPEGENLTISYDDSDGMQTISGTRDEVATALAKAGYIVIHALAGSRVGREARMEPSNPGKWIVQPKKDNYWITCDSLKEAIKTSAK